MAVSEIINGLNGLLTASVNTKLNAQLVEFQKALIPLLSDLASKEAEVATLRNSENDLKAEIVRLKDWSAERYKYELREVSVGVFAQVEKGFMGKLQSAHKFCATCFNKGVKTPLQMQHVEVGRQLSLVCHPCKSTVVFRHFIEHP